MVSVCLIMTVSPVQAPAQQFMCHNREFSETIDRFAAGLQSLGLEKGERVALFSEGSSRWMVADQGIMSAGGVDAVRGGGVRAENGVHLVSM